ncbi:MAG TPA: NAD(P)H-binding protein [Solirubrobacteraceae bacterium]|nr:NAD(P)H-binding protein [Solirubrobacteraceae bacterium]
MRILVTGASGFVGSLLVPRLCADGHAVRALGRDPQRVRAALARSSGTRALQAVEIVPGDVLSMAGMARALADVEVAYYLIHSIERTPTGSGTFAERDRRAAENFAAGAVRAGVRRIVYLGGLLPRMQAAGARSRQRTEVTVSRHLASREDVERVLLAAVPDSLALRASIVIGARSRSFRLLVHLLERMPVLTLPAWRTLRTQPIDERDVIAMLSACAAAQLPRRSLDIGGPDVLSYGEMLEVIAELMLVNRPTLALGVNLTGLTARVAAAMAGEDPELVIALMEGLRGDLLPADDRAAELLGVRLHTFNSAVEHALAEWERSEPLAAR